MSRPPRLALWLLGAGLPRSLREAVIGDLVEAWIARADRDGARPANRWLWRECWTVWRSLAPLSDEPTTLTPPRPPMHGFWNDVRFALRMFRRRPGYAAVALATLTIGIGASTAIFSVVKPVLLEGLPYPGAGRLVSIWERDATGAQSNLGFATFVDLQAGATTLASAAPVAGWSPTLLGAGEPTRLTGQRVGHRFFGTLGVAPALGRDFGPEDDLPGVARVVIVAHDLWRDRLGGDPAIIGQTISLDGSPATVVGILPPDFESLLNPAARIWSPLRYGDQPWACRTCRHLRAVARLAPDTEVSRSEAELAVVMKRLVATFPDQYAVDGTVLLEPLQTTLTKNSRLALLTLFGAVSLVLVLACTNVANLALAHAIERRREFAVRMALGSGRGRLVRQVLLESTLLGLTGSVAAVAIGAAATGLLRGAASGLVPRANAIGLDWGVLGFSALIGMLAGIGFGLLPALVGLESARDGLRDGLRITRRHPVRRGLVVAEVTIAVMLVAGAGLLVKSMSRLLAVDPGFDPDRVLTADIQVAGQHFDTDSATVRYFAAVRDAVAALPGVRSVDLASQLPLSGDFDRYGVHFASRPQANPEDDPAADRYAVSPGFFGTMRIPLVAGRLFTEADRAGSAPVAILSRALAESAFPDGNAIGQQLRVGDPAGRPFTVVGVVGDIRHVGLDQASPGQVYYPFDQWFFADQRMIAIVRTDGDPAALAAPLARAVRALDASPTIANVRPMAAVIGTSTADRRMVLALFGALAAVAMVLAAVGIFGVMATGVAERKREFGIRSALGASGASLTGGVVAESLVLGGAGIGLGLLLAGLAARALGAALFEVAPIDPVVYLGTALGIGGLVAAAAWIPARRAARNDPLAALRAD